MAASAESSAGKDREDQIGGCVTGTLPSMPSMPSMPSLQPLQPLQPPFPYRAPHRVGDGVAPVALSRHRTCGSAYGGSLNTLEALLRSQQRNQP
jgi:hypothetical protein